jgi:NAD(P)-dependent dehydrogenase (short-subunit alcohol dehydrogenase family)
VNKIALATGAGSGVGRAVSVRLQQAGWTVVLAGRRMNELQATADMGDSRTPMVPVPADISDPVAAEMVFTHMKDRFGRLDLLFNNAGVSLPPTPIEELTFEQWSRVISINLSGSFLCAKHAVALMKSQQPQGGRIINNGSISAHVPRPHSVPYTTSKHAITGLTKCLALDGRPFNIACGQIDIGNAATDMSGYMTTGALQADGEVRPEPRIDVRHVADAVLYMASLPLEANVPFVTVMATGMPLFGRG